MADNIGYTPGSGATIAADEIGGVLYQRMKIGIGADGAATDISTANPMPITAPNALSVSAANAIPISTSQTLGVSATGALTTTETGELVEAVEALRMAVQSLTRTVGQTLPDATGRMRVVAETGSTTVVTSLPTLGTVTTVGTVTTMSNQTSLGGFIAADQIPALMCMAAQGLRRNITVT
jgi:hypothetical protein